MTDRRTRALSGLVLATMLWGSCATFVKYALDSWQPLTLLTVQLTGANVVLWTAVALRGYRRPPQLGRLAFAGLLEPGLAYALITIGLLHTTASNAAVISGLEAGLIVLLAALFLREHLDRRKVLGLLLAVVGVLVLQGARPDSPANIGDALVFAGILSAALYALVAREVAGTVDSLSMTAHQFGFGLVVVLPFGAGEMVRGGPGVLTDHSVLSWLVALGIGIVGFAVSFLLFNHALAFVRASHAGMILNLMPVFGVASAVVVIGERLGLGQLCGAAIVTASIFMFGSHEEDPDATDPDDSRLMMEVT